MNKKTFGSWGTVILAAMSLGYCHFTKDKRDNKSLAQLRHQATHLAYRVAPGFDYSRNANANITGGFRELFLEDISRYYYTVAKTTDQYDWWLRLKDRFYLEDSENPYTIRRRINHDWGFDRSGDTQNDLAQKLFEDMKKLGRSNNAQPKKFSALVLDDEKGRNFAWLLVKFAVLNDVEPGAKLRVGDTPSILNMRVSIGSDKPPVSINPPPPVSFEKKHAPQHPPATPKPANRSTNNAPRTAITPTPNPAFKKFYPTPYAKSGSHSRH